MNRTSSRPVGRFFVCHGMAALLFLALKVGNLSSAHLAETYVLEAKFDNIGGLKVRGPVKSAGVVVGRVADIKFDTDLPMRQWCTIDHRRPLPVSEGYLCRS
jgi:phospholipid/cholesterol/gamma-HCH transport system substrate-binding protein